MTSSRFARRAALVQGITGGVGRALAEQLLSDGWELVVGTHRGATPTLAPALEGAGDRLALVAMDLEVEGTIAEGAAAVGELLTRRQLPLELAIVTTGILHESTDRDDAVAPERRLADLAPDRLLRSFAVNAVGPALALKHLAPLLPRQGAATFAALSARVGSIGDNRLGGWYGYRASKAALNQLLRTASVELRRRHPDLAVLALHPGTVTTRLSEPFRGRSNPATLQSPAESAAHLLQVIEARDASSTGGFFAWDDAPIPY